MHDGLSLIDESAQTIILSPRIPRHRAKTEDNLYDRQRLIELVKKHALRFGDFTLASGKQASYYLDCRKLTLDSEGANVIAAGVLDSLGDDFPDAVGGMAIGADPITAAVIVCAWQQDKPLKGFIVRKEAKAHGTGQQVEGPVEPGQTAVMLEDVITTGGSSLRAIEHAREFGLKVDRIIAIVDRGENSAEIFEKVGVRFTALIHVSELGV
jgi:orotate phosphoribosyltransferase